MNILQSQLPVWQTHVLDACRTMTGFGVNWLIQSTVLIGFGLLAGWLVARRGSAAQSATYRTTLVAVLVCPFVGLLMSRVGVSGWSMELPHVYRVSGPSDANTTPAKVAATQRDSSVIEHAPTGPQRGTLVRSLDASAAALGSPPPLIAEVAHEEALDHAATVAGTANTTSNVSAVSASPAVSAPAVVMTPAQVIEFEVFRFGIAATLFTAIWIVAATVLLARMLVAIRHLYRIRRSSVSVTAEEKELCGDIARQLGVRTPAVRRSPFLTSPLLHGVMKPAILLPDEEQLILRDVFIHELAHLRRQDCQWLLLKQIALALLCFQPLLWWLARRIDASAEEVCDDFVVQYGADRQRYATALVDIAALSVAPVAGMGMVSFRSMLGHRVSRILDPSRALSTRVGGILLLVVFAAGLAATAAVGLVGLRPAAAAPVPAEERQADEPQSVDRPFDAAAAVSPASRPADVAEESSKDSSVSEVITGRVVGHDGQPAASAKLYWFRTRVHDLDPMQPKLLATSGPDGRFSFSPPTIPDPKTELASWDYSDRVIVVAEGHGFMRTHLDELRRKYEMTQPETRKRFEDAGIQLKPNVELPAEGNSIRGRIVDVDGNPVVGATIRIRYCEDDLRAVLETTDPDQLVIEWRKKSGWITMIIEPVCQRFAVPSATTNENGEFALSGLPETSLCQLLLEGDGIQSTDIFASNVITDDVLIPPGRRSTEKPRTIHGRDFSFAASPSTSVTGVVRDLDSNEPVPNAVVRAYSVHGERVSSSRERQHFATRTDENGRYTISGLPIGKGNTLVAFATDDVPYIPVGARANTSSGGKSLEVNFGLKQGLWAEGRVTDGDTGEPFTGGISYHWFPNKDIEAAIPGVKHAYLDGRYWTNVNGEFRVPVLPTRSILAFDWDGDSFQDPRPIDRFPRGLGAEVIDGLDERLNYFPTRPSIHPGNFNFVLEVNPQPGDKTIRADMELKASQPVQIQIVAPDGMVVPDDGYLVYGLNERWGWQDEQPVECVVEDLKPGESRKIFVFHREAKIGGAAMVSEQSEQPVKIELMKTGSVKGRVFDKNGELVTDGSISVAYEKLQSDEPYAIWASHPDKRAMPSVIPADEDGYFELDGLIPGWKYSARVNAPRKRRGEMTSMIIGMAFVDLEIEPGESRDLGDVSATFPKKE